MNNNRRSIRLQGYDYRQAGSYYVTICCHQKRCLFGDVINENRQLNIIEKTVEVVWYSLPINFDFIELDSFVIMPNHLHGVILIKDNHIINHEYKILNNQQYLHPSGTKSKSLNAIIQNFKSVSTRKINSLTKNKGTIWQRGYYETIIRNEDHYNHVRQYIINNPLNWDNDEENITKFKPLK